MIELMSFVLFEFLIHKYKNKVPELEILELYLNQ